MRWYLLLFMTYALLFIWIIIFTFLYHKKLSPHTGMMISMTLGMTVGLGVGTFIGLLHPHYFFQATFISVLVAGVIGCISGIPISLSACLEGLLGGIMGGMMGAMLGVMLPTETADGTIKLMALLSGGTLFLLFLIMQSEVSKDKKKLPIFLKPSSYFVAVCLFLFASNQYHFTEMNEHQPNHQESEVNHHKH